MKFLLIELPLTVYVYGTGIPSLRLMQNIQSICINPIFDRRHTNNGSIKKGFIGRKERLETVNQIKVSGSIQSYYYFAIIFDYFLLFDNIFVCCISFLLSFLRFWSRQIWIWYTFKGTKYWNNFWYSKTMKFQRREKYNS